MNARRLPIVLTLTLTLTLVFAAAACGRGGSSSDASTDEATPNYGTRTPRATTETTWSPHLPRAAAGEETTTTTARAGSGWSGSTGGSAAGSSGSAGGSATPPAPNSMYCGLARAMVDKLDDVSDPTQGGMLHQLRDAAPGEVAPPLDVLIHVNDVSAALNPDDPSTVDALAQALQMPEFRDASSAVVAFTSSYCGVILHV